MDHAGQTWISLFNDQAEQLLGMTGDELHEIREQAGTEGDEYKQVFEGGMWGDWVLSLKVKSEEYNGEARVKTVVQSMKRVDYKEESAKLAEYLNEIAV